MERLSCYRLGECSPHHRFGRRDHFKQRNWHSGSKNFIYVCSDPESLVSHCLNAFLLAFQPTRKRIIWETQRDKYTQQCITLSTHHLFSDCGASQNSGWTALPSPLTASVFDVSQSVSETFNPAENIHRETVWLILTTEKTSSPFQWPKLIILSGLVSQGLNTSLQDCKRRTKKGNWESVVLPESFHLIYEINLQINTWKMK